MLMGRGGTQQSNHIHHSLPDSCLERYDEKNGSATVIKYQWIGRRLITCTNNIGGGTSICVTDLTSTYRSVCWIMGTGRVCIAWTIIYQTAVWKQLIQRVYQAQYKLTMLEQLLTCASDNWIGARVSISYIASTFNCATVRIMKTDRIRIATTVFNLAVV